MSIKDYSKYFDVTTFKANHAPFFPKNIFAIIAGSTGCGKTNLLLNLLLEDDFLDYGSVYIYCSTFYQPAYQFLKKYPTQHFSVGQPLANGGFANTKHVGQLLVKVHLHCCGLRFGQHHLPTFGQRVYCDGPT